LSSTPLPDTITSDSAYLFAALELVKQRLTEYQPTQDGQVSAQGEATPMLSKTVNAHSFALDRIVERLKLSVFEKNTLLLCAGTELDSELGETIAGLQGNPKLVHPSFNLALRIFPNSKLNALAPTSALRYWDLIRINHGVRKLTSPLQIDEHILYYLLGMDDLHPELEGLVEIQRKVDLISPSQEALLESIIKILERTDKREVIHLKGADPQDMLSLSVAVTRLLSHSLYRMAAGVIPGDTSSRKKLLKLWNREARLHNYFLLIDCTGLTEGDKNTLQNVNHFLQGLEKGFVVGFPEKIVALAPETPRFEVANPSREEQYQLWQENLPKNFPVAAITSQFDLSTHKISSITGQISEGEKNKLTAKLLWQYCREATRPKIDDLARRIDTRASWDDLVLPEQQMQTLQEIVGQVKHRHKVYEDWGFASKSNRGLGISALFAGASGTGKTTAAEVIANELDLDLLRIDLSQVVNKYIGETEKNLKLIIDSAELSGAILLFDEADALFGKRQEVSDQVSSFSNIEVSYLLQRMESYSGLAILTTNMKNAIDTAFFRRIRFILDFKQPDTALREQIWKKVFPRPQNRKGSIVGKLDYAKLARLNIAGGNIKNIALNAAFLAADRKNGVVEMADILRAARVEYQKLERTLSRSEIKDWLNE